jgi:hypothetical protein
MDQRGVLSENDREKTRVSRLGVESADRYRQLPAGGRLLMANPRHIEYILKGTKQTAAPETSGERQEPSDPFNYTLADTISTSPTRKRSRREYFGRSKLRHNRSKWF